MSTAAIPQNEPNESDLLVPLEIQHIPADYREYYKAKRGNFLANVQSSGIWKAYILLDKLWLREFDDLKPSNSPSGFFPLILFMNAHAKMRVSMELGFSGCMAEARSLLRDAVECVAHGHRMLADPELQKTWLSKNDGKAALEAFKDAFVRQKKKGLFKGLEELYEWWRQLSETGSHSTINAMCDRFIWKESEKEVEWRLNYCGVEPQTWAMSLFSMLLTCFSMERTMFCDYETRLKLDDGLLRMRTEFERHKEGMRRNFILRFGIKQPSARPLIHRP